MSAPCRTIQMVTGLRNLPSAPAGVSSRSSAPAISSSSAFVHAHQGATMTLIASLAFISLEAGCASLSNICSPVRMTVSNRSWRG